MNVMNGIHGLDTSLDLEYVLELPADRASTLRDELLSAGVPDDSIVVLEPGRVNREEQDSHQRRASRFLPSTIKLGTYAGGQYNVVMRKRTVPKGRETVWISMVTRPSGTAVQTTSTAPTAQCNDNVERFNKPVAASEHNDGGGGGDNNYGDGPMAIITCHCANTECDNYRKMLNEYLHDNCSDLNGDGVRRCVYKRIIDVLFAHKSGIDGTIIPTNNVVTVCAKTYDNNRDLSGRNCSLSVPATSPPQPQIQTQTSQPTSSSGNVAVCSSSDDGRHKSNDHVKTKTVDSLRQSNSGNGGGGCNGDNGSSVSGSSNGGSGDKSADLKPVRLTNTRQTALSDCVLMTTDLHKSTKRTFLDRLLHRNRKPKKTASKRTSALVNGYVLPNSFTSAEKPRIKKLVSLKDIKSL